MAGEQSSATSLISQLKLHVQFWENRRGPLDHVHWRQRLSSVDATEAKDAVCATIVGDVDLGGRRGIAGCPLIIRVLALSRGEWDEHPCSVEVDQFAKLLIEYGADFTQKYGAFKGTVLHLALWAEADSVVEYIAEHLWREVDLNTEAKAAQGNLLRTVEQQAKVFGTKKAKALIQKIASNQLRETEMAAPSASSLRRTRATYKQEGPEEPRRKKQKGALKNYDPKKLEVKPSHIPGAGQGLFLKRNVDVIRRGDAIVGMVSATFGPAPEPVKNLVEELGHAREASEIVRGGITVHDACMNGNTMLLPLWYRANHGSKSAATDFVANSEIVLQAECDLADGQPIVFFRALTDIYPGTEILVYYGDEAELLFNGGVVAGRHPTPQPSSPDQKSLGNVSVVTPEADADVSRKKLPSRKHSRSPRKIACSKAGTQNVKHHPAPTNSGTARRGSSKVNPLPEGWTVKATPRSNNRLDRIYTSPEGLTFRSLKAVRSHIDDSLTGNVPTKESNLNVTSYVTTEHVTKKDITLPTAVKSTKRDHTNITKIKTPPAAHIKSELHKFYTSIGEANYNVKREVERLEKLEECDRKLSPGGSDCLRLMGTSILALERFLPAFAEDKRHASKYNLALQILYESHENVAILHDRLDHDDAVLHYNQALHCFDMMEGRLRREANAYSIGAWSWDELHYRRSWVYFDLGGFYYDRSESYAGEMREQNLQQACKHYISAIVAFEKVNENKERLRKEMEEYFNCAKEAEEKLAMIVKDKSKGANRVCVTDVPVAETASSDDGAESAETSDSDKEEVVENTPASASSSTRRCSQGATVAAYVEALTISSQQSHVDEPCEESPVAGCASLQQNNAPASSTVAGSTNFIEDSVSVEDSISVPTSQAFGASTNPSPLSAASSNHEYKEIVSRPQGKLVLLPEFSPDMTYSEIVTEACKQMGVTDSAGLFKKARLCLEIVEERNNTNVRSESKARWISLNSKTGK